MTAGRGLVSLCWSLVTAARYTPDGSKNSLAVLFSHAMHRARVRNLIAHSVLRKYKKTSNQHSDASVS